MPLQKSTGRVSALCFHSVERTKRSLKGVPGPSAIAARGGEGHFARYGLDKTAGYSVPTPLENPRQIIEDEFKRGAINAKAAGFDGVECKRATSPVWCPIYSLPKSAFRERVPRS